MKICSKCKNEKSLLLFNKCLAKKDGLMNWCKECVRTYDQKRFPSFYALNKEKILSKQNTARRNNLEAYLLSSAKARAKRKK